MVQGSECPERFLGIIGRDPSVSKSNRLHVHICQFFPHEFEVYSLSSSKTLSDFPEVLKFKRLFLESNQLMCNELAASCPVHRSDHFSQIVVEIVG